MKIKSKRPGLLFLLVLLAAAAFTPALAGCTPEEIALSFPWQDGEISVMDVKQGGTLVLVNELQVRREGSELLLTNEYLMLDHPMVQRFYLDPDTLMPLRTEYEARTAAGAKYLRADYGEKDVIIQRDTDDGTVENKVRLPAPPYYDNDSFLLLVRSLPLEEGWKGSVNLVVTGTARKVAIGLEVTGRETVTVPAGTFDCYIVELKRTNQWAWVSVDAPHQLVKYENHNADSVMELVEFYPTGRE